METFSETFIAALDSVEDRAKAIGLSASELCRRAGISRATPMRWRHNPPNTAFVMDRLQVTVLVAEREFAKANEAPPPLVYVPES